MGRARALVGMHCRARRFSVASQWDQIWASGGAPTFHLPHVNANLLGYLKSKGGAAAWGGGTLDRRPRALLPLCGKTVDLAHLAGAGFDVVGIDCAEVAFQQFSADNRLPLFKGPHTGNFQVFAPSSKARARCATLRVYVCVPEFACHCVCVCVCVCVHRDNPVREANLTYGDAMAALQGVFGVREVGRQDVTSRFPAFPSYIAKYGLPPHATLTEFTVECTHKAPHTSAVGMQ